MSHDKPIAKKPSLKLGTYQHYSGKLYELIHLACHEETHEWYVVYQPLYDTKGLPDVWIRPAHMFSEVVSHEGQSVQRFRHIREGEGII